MNRNKPTPSPAPAHDHPENTQKSPAKAQPKEELPGKTDSGPEPDVFGREIPPQD